MLSVRQLLTRALGELKQDGWTKGDFHDEKGQHCALGAVEDVLRDEFGAGKSGWSYFDVENAEAVRLYERAAGVLDNVARDRNNGYFAGIADFNDHDKTTFDMIRDAFREAISRAKVAP